MPRKAANALSSKVLPTIEDIKALAVASKQCYWIVSDLLKCGEQTGISGGQLVTATRLVNAEGVTYDFHVQEWDTNIADPRQ